MLADKGKAFSVRRKDYIYAAAQIAVGGSFTLEQTAVAAVGGKSSGGNFSVEGTTAQTIAGTRSADSTKALHGGFGNASTFAPTAAN